MFALRIPTSSAGTSSDCNVATAGPDQQKCAYANKAKSGLTMTRASKIRVTPLKPLELVIGPLSDPRVLSA